jgi:hypothetical protein
VALAGCSGQTIDPFRDVSAVPEESMTTASVETIREAGKAAAIRVRPWESSTLASEDGTVTHWPLWWEDPFEDRGSEDGADAWTWEDYAGLLYCPARFVLNTAAWPVSAIVTPAGTVLCSDGRISKQLVWRDHDAHVCGAGQPGPDSFVPVAARPSVAASREPVEQPAQAIPDFEPEY